MQYKQKDKNARNNESFEYWPFWPIFITFLGIVKMPKNCLFCKNFLCNILLHMQQDLYIIYSNLCTLYANKTPSFCPPEKNGISRQSKRLRFDFIMGRYVYTPSAPERFCIIIPL